MNTLKIALLSLLIAPNLLQAAEDELGWSGSGELGYVAARGNTDTETLKVGLNGAYNMENWLHSLFFNALNSSDSDVTTADRFELGGQSDYKIDETAYWFGSFRYEDDEFSQFDSQATLAAGYGRTLIDNEIHRLKGELGLGYRVADVRATGESVDEAIARGALNYTWTISETAKFTNKTLVEAGSDNTFATNETALETRINSSFGLKLAYEIRHNTEVDDPTNNSDFLTTVNLIYNFK